MSNKTDQVDAVNEGYTKMAEGRNKVVELQEKVAELEGKLLKIDGLESEMEVLMEDNRKLHAANEKMRADHAADGLDECDRLRDRVAALEEMEKVMVQAGVECSKTIADLQKTNKDQFKLIREVSGSLYAAKSDLQKAGVEAPYIIESIDIIEDHLKPKGSTEES